MDGHVTDIDPTTSPAENAIAECEGRIAALLGADAVDLGRSVFLNAGPCFVAYWQNPNGQPRFNLWPGVVIHEEWKRQSPNEPHPLAPLVIEWQRRITHVDSHPNVMFPNDLNGLPPMDDDTETSLDQLLVQPEQEETRLFGGPTRQLVPPYMLETYDRTAGAGRTIRGHAAVAQRVFIEAWSWLPRNKRDGAQYLFHRRLDELVAAIWPYGGFNLRLSLPRLSGACEMISGNQFDYRTENGSISRLRPVVFTDFPVVAAPSVTTLNSYLVRGALTLPAGADRGVTLSRAVIRHAGTISGPALRAAVAWAFYRARYLMQNWRLFSPTRPVMRRDARGRLLDGSGSLILGRTGKPASRFMNPRAIPLDADGVPAPDVSSAARERNPMLDRAPAYSLDEWRAGHYSQLPTDKGAARTQRAGVISGIEAMVNCNVFAIEDEQGRPIALDTDDDGNRRIPRGTNKFRLIPPGTLGKSPSPIELRTWHEDQLRKKAERRKRQRHSAGLAAEHRSLFED